MSCLCQHALSLTKYSVKPSFFKVFVNNQHALSSFLSRNISTLPIEYSKDKDPTPFYFNNEIQNLLKKLTRIDIDKVFKSKRLETKELEAPVYKFMTDEQLQDALKDVAERANDMLQMPPVVKIRESINEVISRDSALQGLSTAKYVFTDITYGVSDRDRVIVIRDTDGNLVKADWDTRHRMNQIYFPQPGRELRTPHMFEDDYFNNLLERKEYEFILDRACVQFEPDDPMYQKITSVTYQHVNEQNDFELLRSTRHFGPLSFFLVWFKMFDQLLLELIETSHISDANTLITLYNKLHEKDAIGNEIVLKSEEDTVLVEKYMEKSAIKGQFVLALQSYKELLKQKQELEQGIKKAHGLV